MKFIKSKKECEYIISKERRQVICVMNGTKYGFTSFINQLDQCGNDLFKYVMPSTFIGVATCAPEDEWDEQLGKDIAYAKAAEKYNKSFFKRAQTYTDDMDTMLNDIVDKINKYGDQVRHCQETRREWLQGRIEQNIK